ncbi:uncharacterized protein LOC110384726 isoform X2 [Bombyx mori]|uniref:uncharacterized protein LOC110384726 isoform X2 n=1 Tax=Bombyx mori TaxID=7091 RepID=UPI002ED1C0BB
MSYVDLATLTMHRRNELEGRINMFLEKCDHAINDIKKMKTKAQGFVLQLNCDPAELKERFLKSMKLLDEFTYLITDFNLATGQIEDLGSSEYTPVPDTTPKLLPTPQLPTLNLLDALSEPTPSTSQASMKVTHTKKPKRLKSIKDDQTLITFSSSSCSSESVPLVKTEVVSKEVQCEIVYELEKLDIEDNQSQVSQESCKLPAQSMLEVDNTYSGTIMHVDGSSFWIITEDTDIVYRLMLEMTEYYTKNYRKMNLKEVKILAYCAVYDGDCYYRGLFLNLIEDGTNTAEVYIVDTGETRCFHIDSLQPLVLQFCDSPPYARCCHLAGVDPINYNDMHLVEKLEECMRNYIGTLCKIEIDDNSSESLGVYVILPDNQTLNQIIVQQEFANAINRPVSPAKQAPAVHCPPELVNDSSLDITHCPEYEDPVEAVTGYHNRDEADICKHYKGGPSATCFKGAKCKKKHIVKHPDGWTLDRVEVVGKCKSIPLPEPGTWHKVLVTCVCHYDRVYFQIIDNKEPEQIPDFGVVLPPATLESLVRDMNSPAARITYKPLKLTPAPGEMVAALYPLDDNWYRARVLSLTRPDQSVEVMYVDYGTVLWVKEDQIRHLEARYTFLPMQAVRCVLAGVTCPSHDSQHWAAAKRVLGELTQDKLLDAHIISRDYDEVAVELFNSDGYSIAEQLAARDMVDLVEYSVVDDTKTQCRLPVKALARLAQQSRTGRNDLPTLANLLSFLEAESRGYKNMPSPSSGSRRPGSGHALSSTQRGGGKGKKGRSRRLSALMAVAESPQCSFCHESGHDVSSCPKFRSTRIKGRRNIVAQRRWCFFCFGPHTASVCTHQQLCPNCNGRHHALLCLENSVIRAQPASLADR